MYGLVNRALQEMVVSEQGLDVWEEIKLDAGVDIGFFLSHEAYPDEVTYALAGAASRKLQLPLPDVLERFGIYWVLETATRGYGSLLSAGGRTLGEFLHNLHVFHQPVELIFPKLKPPVFSCSDVRPGSLRLHYRSHRTGLAPFVVGIIKGLAKRFSVAVKVDHVVKRGDHSDHDVFQVEWEVPTA